MAVPGWLSVVAITAGVTCTTEIQQISSSLPPEVAANNLEK